MRILIAGCGYVGTALGRRLVGEGHEVHALRRRTRDLPRELLPVAADLTRPETLRGLGSFERVVYAAAADRPDEDAYRAAYVEGLRNLLGAIGEAGRLVYVSSTSVYGQHGGEWVDEGSPVQPSGFRGRRVLEGEAIASASGLPATRVRFGGIYGPGRTRLLERVRRGEARFRPGHYTNRIHLDDCVGVLRHVLRLAEPAPDPDPVYVAVDEEPALEQTVLEWLAERLGAPPPRAAARSPTPGGSGSRRCSSRLLRARGYHFQKPSFRQGYAALLSSSHGVW